MQWRTYADIETDLCLLNMGSVLGIKLYFIIGTEYHRNKGLDKMTELDFLLGDYIVLFCV